MTARKKRKSRSRTGRSKGSYLLPNGDQVLRPTVGAPDKKGRRIRVVGIQRAEPDAKKLAQVLINIAVDQLKEERKVQKP